MRSRGRRPAGLAAGIVVACGFAGSGCSSGATQVRITPVEIEIASGDGQFGVVGESVGAPLRVMVRSVATGRPREGVSILWNVMAGDASIVGVPTTVTDSTGSTETQLRMGAAPGEVRVRARVAEQEAASTTFQLFAVNRPSLTRVTPTVVAPGEAVTLTGRNFATEAEQNVVLFSGIRGEVTSASPTVLEVVVPVCLPARGVVVSVQLGAVAPTSSIPVTITEGGHVTELPVGGFVDVDDDLSCHSLSGGTGAEYLLLPYSASAVAAAEHPFELTVLGSSTPAVAPPNVPPLGVASEPGDARGLQAAWDQHVRALEGQLLGRRPAPRERPLGSPPAGPARAPALGDRRMFSVLNAADSFDVVTAEARYVGSRAAIFVDESAPGPPKGFDTPDLAALAARFDEVIHPTVTDAFGAASDLDANGRVIILFTPGVNGLTPRGSSGFIGGYFFGEDLVTTSEVGNHGEIFYALVPDPDGLFSDPRAKDQILRAVPAVLAHEFQHMVHFNERVLVRGGAGQGALWLSEGLAQMAEELVARAYDAQNDPTSGELFRAGARARARRYLLGPDTVSVAVTYGTGSLPERGAGFLFALYLEDQLGLDVLRGLTRTTRTGVANVEAETGTAWAELLGDWWSATYLDGPGPESGPLTYPSVALRDFLDDPFPLVPVHLPAGSATPAGSLRSSSVRYYLVSPSPGTTVSVRLGGDAGGPSPVQAALRLRLIRIS